MEETRITLRVRLFAALKDRLGRSEVSLELPATAQVADLLRAIAAHHPELAPLLPGVRVAVDQAFVGPDHALRAPQEVALLPPVSGG